MRTRADAEKMRQTEETGSQGKTYERTTTEIYINQKTLDERTEDTVGMG